MVGRLAEEVGAMFIVGLLVGPVLGLVAADFAFGSRGISPWVAAVGLVVLCALLLALPVLDLGLRIGVIGGLLLGVLLSRSPLTIEGVQQGS
jgi:hypothetical protein